MSIISVSFPAELLEELDSILGDEKYATRSEVLRQAVRSYLTEYKELEKFNVNVIATITVLYGKKQSEELYKLQHEFSDVIAAYLHSHLTENSCLEVMVFKGPSEHLKNLVDGLKANKLVKQIKFSVMVADETY